MSFYTTIESYSIFTPIDASEHFVILQMEMPHIAREVEKRWGSVALGNYIAKVMFDTRNDTRKGFPKRIADAIWAISKANNEEHQLHRFHTAPIVRSSGDWSMERINR